MCCRQKYNSTIIINTTVWLPLNLHPLRSMYCTSDIPSDIHLNTIQYTINNINLRMRRSPLSMVHPSPQLQTLADPKKLVAPLG